MDNITHHKENTSTSDPKPQTIDDTLQYLPQSIYTPRKGKIVHAISKQNGLTIDQPNNPVSMQQPWFQETNRSCHTQGVPPRHGPNDSIKPKPDTFFLILV